MSCYHRPKIIPSPWILNMPYLIQPPATSTKANNPLYTYTIATPDATTPSIIHTLHTCGWIISHHTPSDPTYLHALHATEKATKQRRRRTQIVHGNLIGPPLTPTLSNL